MHVNRHCALTTVIMACCYFLLSLVWVGPAAHANATTEELERKTADIVLLKSQLADRIQQADAVLREITVVKDALVNEIRLLIENYHVGSAEEAMAHPRLAYDFKLMQFVLAYTEAFADKIRFYHAGEDKLAYLQQLVQDDLKMSATMNHYEIDALTTQISMMVNKYMAQAHIIQIDTRNLEQPSTQHIWHVIHGPH